ncbi:MAG: glycosyltransferase family 4 protein [Peptostreptococcaceae bacterium]|nr:glycosyltransferase family 4 protein [Peptostreptococcaceae bacterium]
MKILYVTTISSTTSFFISHVNMLLDQGHSVDFACNIIKPVNQSLLDRGCKVFQVHFSRFPLSKSNFQSAGEIRKIMQKGSYDVVHVHTPVAAAITRLVCKKFQNITVMYTAHGFHFFKGAPLVNWLLYYPVEKYLSKYTNVLITINQEDYERAKSKFKAKQIEYVPGVGIDVNRFSEVSIDRVKKRADLGIPENSYVLVSVGELNKNKNHQTVIRALKKLNNPNIQYVLCGAGPLKKQLVSLIAKLNLESQVKLLGYRRDIPEILKAADLFVFPSRREGLGLAALEAMASGLPIITSNIHGIKDYSKNGFTGFSCSPNDNQGFATAIKSLFDNPRESEKFIVHNKQKVVEFSASIVLQKIEEIYKGVTEGIYK